ncbi:MAG: alpha/beta fold hydrolase [Herpetosiphon sp.]
MAPVLDPCIGGMEPRRSAVQVGAQTVALLEWGNEGPPLVLLHGITSDARAWWQAGPRFAGMGKRVIAFDMPGHGGSSSTPRHEIEAIAQLIAGACEILELNDCTVIGHSWGGAAALALARLTGVHRWLRRIVLVDPLLAMTPDAGAQRVDRYLEDVGTAAAETEARIAAKNPDWAPCDVRWKAYALERCRAEQVKGLFCGSGSWDLVPTFTDVDMPLLLLVADLQYTVISPSMLAAVRSALGSQGELVVVPGTTHNMLRGAGYGATMALIEKWLRSDFAATE